MLVTLAALISLFGLSYLVYLQFKKLDDAEPPCFEVDPWGEFCYYFDPPDENLKKSIKGTG